MRTAYDSVNVLALPAGAEVYMGYDDGRWPDAAAIAQTHPGKTVIRITTNPGDNEGDMLDVEKGDANPVDAPGWVQRRREAGHGGPLVYFPEYLRAQVVGAFEIARVPLPGLFSAAYPGDGATLMHPGDVGHQYAGGPTAAYDTSVVIDYLPGIDRAPSPTPPPTPNEEPMAVTQVVQYKPNQLDFFQVSAGSLWHKYNQGTGWQNEHITPPAGAAPFTGSPEAAILGGAVWVTVEDTNGRAYTFMQTPNENTWNNSEVP